MTAYLVNLGPYQRKSVASGYGVNLGIDQGQTLPVAPPYPPTITNHTHDTIIAVGSTLTLTVTVTGQTPFSYQWYLGTTPVGTDSATYSKVLTLGDYGVYTCVVTNIAGVATSDEIRVQAFPTSQYLVNIGPNQRKSTTSGYGVNIGVYQSAPTAIRFFVGGNLNDGSYVWLVEDNGSVLTPIAGVSTAVIPDYVSALAVAATISGGLYAVCDNKVYKMSRTTWGLDLSWATSGVYTAPASITSIAIDASNYIALACWGESTEADAILLDASGVVVWTKAYSSAANKGTAINFRTDNGNVLYAPYFTGSTPQVLELSRIDGATLVTRGDDGTPWRDITACKYIAGGEPYWFSRSQTGAAQVVSADVGTMTSRDFLIETIFAFDILGTGSSGTKITVAGPSEGIPE